MGKLLLQTGQAWICAALESHEPAPGERNNKRSLARGIRVRAGD